MAKGPGTTRGCEVRCGIAIAPLPPLAKRLAFRALTSQQRTSLDRAVPVAGRRRERHVTGESGDVFTQDSSGNVTPREFPEAIVGDLLVLSDAGAYGASVGSNYNSRPLAP